MPPLIQNSSYTKNKIGAVNFYHQLQISKFAFFLMSWYDPITGPYFIDSREKYIGKLATISK